MHIKSSSKAIEDLHEDTCLCSYFSRVKVCFFMHKPCCPRGRILGRNPDTSLKSFPPCYSQSHLQLWLKDLYFFKLTQPLTVSVKEKWGKPERKPYPLPLRNPYRNLKSELSRLCSETPIKLYVNEFGFRSKINNSTKGSHRRASPSPWSMCCYMMAVQKWNSWKYNFVEISGHNLEVSQTWSFYLRFCLSNEYKLQ